MSIADRSSTRPIIVLLWHNQGYEEIRRFMDNAGVTHLGVDIQAPDFQTLAAGFGCAASRGQHALPSRRRRRV